MGRDGKHPMSSKYPMDICSGWGVPKNWCDDGKNAVDAATLHKQGDNPAKLYLFHGDEYVEIDFNYHGGYKL